MFAEDWKKRNPGKVMRGGKNYQELYLESLKEQREAAERKKQRRLDRKLQLRQAKGKAMEDARAMQGVYFSMIMLCRFDFRKVAWCG